MVKFTQCCTLKCVNIGFEVSQHARTKYHHCIIVEKIFQKIKHG